MEIPRFGHVLTFTVVFGAMLLRYFLLAGIFYAYCELFRKGKAITQEASPVNLRRDIRWSILSTAVFAFNGTVMIHLWHEGKTAIYNSMDDMGFVYLFLSLPLVLLIHDTYFYWTHRLMHLPRFFRSIHLAHHESRVPTAWTSFAFHPFEALIQALVFPLIVLTIPLHWSALVAFLTFMSLTGILNHLGHELYPGFLERRLGLISATHHQFHHSHIHQNFGLYFIWWDHLMKTEGSRV